MVTLDDDFAIFKDLIAYLKDGCEVVPEFQSEYANRRFRHAVKKWGPFDVEEEGSFDKIEGATEGEAAEADKTKEETLAASSDP